MPGGSEALLAAEEGAVSEGRAGTSLAVQWLRLCASTAGSTGLIPGWGTKIPHAARCGQKKRKQETK